MAEHKISFKVQGEPVPTPRSRNPPLAMMIKAKKVWQYAGNAESKAWKKAIQKACPERHHFDSAQVRMYFMTNKEPDGDNCEKGIYDALTGYLWDNDKKIWDGHWTRLEPKDEPFTLIEVIGNEPDHVQSALPLPEGWTAKSLGKALSEVV